MGIRARIRHANEQYEASREPFTLTTIPGAKLDTQHRRRGLATMGGWGRTNWGHLNGDQFGEDEDEGEGEGGEGGE